MADAGCSTYILIMSGACPAVCQGAEGMRLSRSKLDEDAVDRVPVVTCKLLPQSPEKRSLLLAESLIGRGFMTVVLPFQHADPAPKAATDRFDWV